MPAPEKWAVVDHWRSVFEALALAHGHDPDDAVDRHRQWCMKEGHETMELADFFKLVAEGDANAGTVTTIAPSEHGALVTVKSRVHTQTDFLSYTDIKAPGFPLQIIQDMQRRIKDRP